MTEVLDLPKHAIERLQGLRKQGSHAGVFTSDLSVNEFLCVKEAGFEPLGLVMGSSVYHIGLQTRRWGKSQEMEVLTQAMYHARELALQRMQEEADALHADGIVGVKLIINRHEWGQHNAEFVAIGTAVAAIDRSVDYRTKMRKPFTSDLTGQDFWTLLKSGYRPLSLSMGSCVYHVAHQSMMKSLGQTGRNVELTNFTQALYDARELAMERMQVEAHKEEAEGIVGVQIQEGSHGWGSHIIEYFAVGTSVTPIPGVSVDNIEKPSMVLSLND
jgi:uncharacterized protein YbjQ (UPF0145 family)